MRKKEKEEKKEKKITGGGGGNRENQTWDFQFRDHYFDHLAIVFRLFFCTET